MQAAIEIMLGERRFSVCMCDWHRFGDKFLYTEKVVWNQLCYNEDREVKFSETFVTASPNVQEETNEEEMNKV